MSEQEQMSQLSALFDNELPPAEADLVIRRLLKDPALRVRWERYSLIGACVRDEPVRISAGQPDVAERVRVRIAAEAERPGVPKHAIARHQGARRGWSQLGRGALGGAIAAGVAVIALVLVRPMGPDAAIPAAQMAASSMPAVTGESAAAPAAQAPVQAQRVAMDSPPASYTTPMQRISGPLASYVVAHSEVAASAGRLLPLSAAMSGYDITQGAVEMTEAEIGAFR